MLKFSNKIINGDCLKELKKIPDKTFDLVFADPPYNMQIGEKLTRPDSSKVNGVNDNGINLIVSSITMNFVNLGQQNAKEF